MPPSAFRSRHRTHCLPLSPRAALRRMFGGMVLFVSSALLGLGAYLIRDQFSNPVGSSAAGLLVAAVLISTGLLLLSYMIHPGWTRESREHLLELPEARPSVRTIEISLGEKQPVGPEASDSPVHGR